MKHIHIREDGSITGELEILTGFRLEDCYTPETIENSVEVADDFTWDSFTRYDRATGTFAQAEPESPAVTRDAKLAEVSAACTQAIYAGVEVGGERYSLTEHDQIEIMSLRAAVMAGASQVPYHADGQPCRLYPASEFLAIAYAADSHRVYHRTYCNALNTWIRRADDSELEGISYGAELPRDLAANMAAVLAGAGG